MPFDPDFEKFYAQNQSNFKTDDDRINAASSFFDQNAGDTSRYSPEEVASARSNFVQQHSALWAPKAPEQDFVGGLRAFGEGLSHLPGALETTFSAMKEGKAIPASGSWAHENRKAMRDAVKPYARDDKVLLTGDQISSVVGKGLTGLLGLEQGISHKALAETPQNLAYGLSGQVLTGAGGIAGGILGGGLGSFVAPGVGTAGGGAVGAGLGRYLLGGLASFIGMDRAAKNEIAGQLLDKLNAESMQTKGRKLTQPEWDAALALYDPEIEKYGTAEAGWETAGNLLTMGLAKIPLGGRLAGGFEKVLSKAGLDEVAAYTGGKILGKGTSALAKVGIDTPIEIGGEALTEMDQAAVEKALGLTQEDAPDFWEAVKRVGPSTLLLGGTHMGTAAAMEGAFGKTATAGELWWEKPYAEIAQAKGEEAANEWLNDAVVRRMQRLGIDDGALEGVDFSPTEGGFGSGIPKSDEAKFFQDGDPLALPEGPNAMEMPGTLALPAGEPAAPPVGPANPVDLLTRAQATGNTAEAERISGLLGEQAKQGAAALGNDSDLLNQMLPTLQERARVAEQTFGVGSAQHQEAQAMVSAVQDVLRTNPVAQEASALSATPAIPQSVEMSLAEKVRESETSKIREQQAQAAQEQAVQAIAEQSAADARAQQAEDFGLGLRAFQTEQAQQAEDLGNRMQQVADDRRFRENIPAPAAPRAAPADQRITRESAKTAETLGRPLLAAEAHVADMVDKFGEGSPAHRLAVQARETLKQGMQAKPAQIPQTLETSKPVPAGPLTGPTKADARAAAKAQRKYNKAQAEADERAQIPGPLSKAQLRSEKDKAARRFAAGLDAQKKVSKATGGFSRHGIFSIRDGQTKPNPKQKKVAAWAKAMGLSERNIDVVDTLGSADHRGMYDAETGRIKVGAEAISNAAELREVVYHEALHRGARSTAYASIIDRAVKEGKITEEEIEDRKARMTEAYKRAGVALPNFDTAEGRMTLLEELLAERVSAGDRQMLSTGDNRVGVTKLVHGVKNLLRKAGFNVRQSDAEFRETLAGMMRQGLGGKEFTESKSFRMKDEETAKAPVAATAAQEKPEMVPLATLERRKAAMDKIAKDRAATPAERRTATRRAVEYADRIERVKANPPADSPDLSKIKFSIYGYHGTNSPTMEKFDDKYIRNTFYGHGHYLGSEGSTARQYGSRVLTFKLPDDIANWDKTIVNQKKAVAKALLKAFRPAFKTLEGLRDWARSTTFEDIYYSVADHLKSQAKASDWFHRIGVPGHEFRESGKDGRPTGTRNFVVYKGETAERVYSIRSEVAKALADPKPGPQLDAEIALPPNSLMSIRTLPAWRTRTETWMKKNGYTPEEISKHLKAIEGQMKIFEALGVEQVEMFPTGAGKNKNKGPIRTNADPIYKISFDASAMCVRRLGAAATATYVQEKLGRALTTSERLALVMLFREAGETAPCLYCYVEAPRAKQGEAVGKAISIALGKSEIPTKGDWSEDMKNKAQAARQEVKRLGLTNVNANLFLDPQYLYENAEEAQELLKKAPAVYTFVDAMSLSAKANLPKLYEEYTSQILDIPQKLVDELNAYAGFRFFSSSDFQAEHVVDIMQAVTDLEIREARAHAYSKVKAFVEIFGDTGMKIQTSLFAKEVDGKFVQDTSQGMDWEDAKKFREKFKNVGTVFIATSDAQLTWAKGQDWIDYIIPFHHSGLPSEYSKGLGWQDFTNTQTEKWINPSSAKNWAFSENPEDRGKEGKKPKPKKIRMHDVGVAKGITDEAGTRKYLQLAARRGLVPVFVNHLFKDGMKPALNKFGKPYINQRGATLKRETARWANMVELGKIDFSQVDPNYFKLKKDFARTDTPFRPVKAKFNMQRVAEITKSFLEGNEPSAKVNEKIGDKLSEMIQNAPEGSNIGLDMIVEAKQKRFSIKMKADEKENRKNYKKATPAKKALAGKKDLIARHNTSTEGLAYIATAGGLMFPSVSVGKKTHAFDGFGPITLILKKEVVDPETARVYDRDVYSPRIPKASPGLIRLMDPAVASGLGITESDLQKLFTLQGFNIYDDAELDDFIKNPDRLKDDGGLETAVGAILSAVTGVRERIRPMDLAWNLDMTPLGFVAFAKDALGVDILKDGKVYILSGRGEAALFKYWGSPRTEMPGHSAVRDAEYVRDQASISADDLKVVERPITEINDVNAAVERIFYENHPNREFLLSPEPGHDKFAKHTFKEAFKKWANDKAHDLLLASEGNALRFDAGKVGYRPYTEADIAKWREEFEDLGTEGGKDDNSADFGRLSARSATQFSDYEDIRAASDALESAAAVDKFRKGAFYEAKQAARDAIMELFKNNVPFSIGRKFMLPFINQGIPFSTSIREAMIGKDVDETKFDAALDAVTQYYSHLVNGPRDYFEAIVPRMVRLDEIAAVVHPATGSGLDKIRESAYPAAGSAGLSTTIGQIFKTLEAAGVKIVEGEGKPGSGRKTATDKLLKDKAFSDSVLFSIKPEDRKIPNPQPVTAEALGFVSTLRQAVSSRLPGKLTGESARSHLRALVAKGQIKAEEWAWSGLDDFLKAHGSAPIKPEAILDHLSSNQLEVEETVLYSGDPPGDSDDGSWAGNRPGDYPNDEGPWTFSRGTRTWTVKKTEETFDGESLAYTAFDEEGGPVFSSPSPDTAAAEVEHVAERFNEYEYESPAASARWAGVTLGGEYNAGESGYREYLFRTPNREGDSYFINNVHYPDHENIVAFMRVADRYTTQGGEYVFHVEELQSDWHQEARRIGYESDPKVDTTGWEAHPDEFHPDKYINVYGADGKLVEQVSTYTAKTPEAAIAAVVNRKERNRLPDAPFRATESWAMFAMKRAIRLAAEEGYDFVAWTPGDEQSNRAGGVDLRKFYDEILVKSVGKYIKAWGGKLEAVPVNYRDKIGEENAIDLHGFRVTPAMKAAVLEDGQALFSIRDAVPLVEMHGRPDDLKLAAKIFSVPAWIAKKFPSFAKIFDRQLDREHEASSATMSAMNGVDAFTNLQGQDLDVAEKILIDLDRRNAQPKTSTSRFRVDGKAPNGADLIELNEDHYEQYGAWVKKEFPQASKAAIAGVVAVRRSLDAALVKIHNRFAAEAKPGDNEIKKLRQSFGMLQSYFPRKREGGFYVRALDETGRVVYREHFDYAVGKLSKAALQKKLDAVAKKAGLKNVTWEGGENVKVPEDVFSMMMNTAHLDQMIVAAADRLQTASDTDREAMMEALRGSVAEVFKLRGFGEHLVRRASEPIAGHRTTGLKEVLFEYHSGMNGWLAKMQAAKDFTEQLKDIKAVDQPRLWAYSAQYVKDMLANRTNIDRLVGTAKALFFIKYLGGNIKSAAVNLTQNLILGIPMLTSHVKGGGAGAFFKAAGRDLNALLSLSARPGKANLSKVEASRARLLKEMFAEGAIADQFMREAQGLNDGKLTGVWRKISQVLGWPMGFAERFNRASLALAAYDAARSGRVVSEEGLSRMGMQKPGKADYAQAKRFAEMVVRDAHFVIGKSNMPQAFRGGEAGKLVSSAYTFRSFSHNIALAYHHLLSKRRRDGGGKAVLQSVGMLLGLGGLTALPLYGLVRGSLRALGEDPEEKLRRRLKNGKARDILTYGLPAVFDTQISGSLGMELPLMKELTQGKTTLGAMAESLIGIPAAVAGDFVKASQALGSKQYGRAAEALAPAPVRNVLSAARLKAEGQHSLSGKPIVRPGEAEPRKLTTREAMMKGAGFQPLQATKDYSAYENMQIIEKRKDAKKTQWANRYANARNQKDVEAMAAVRAEVKAWNAKQVKDGTPEMVIDIEAAIKARSTGAQPPKELRKRAIDMRKIYE